MSIYEKELNTRDEIFDEVKNICENKNLGSKLEISRMFLAAKKEYKALELRKQFEERVTAPKNHIKDIIVLDEKTAIVSYLKTGNPEHGCWYQPIILCNFHNVIYETFEQALIGLVCLKTNNLGAEPWVYKLLNIYD